MVVHGSLIARGRTSDVHGWGNDAVVKVLRRGVPGHWAAMEARFTDAIGTLGLPVPGVLDTTTVDDRQAVVFERIDGPSMWEQMVASPSDVSALSRELAAVHRGILSAGLPDNVSGLVDRMEQKIASVDRFDESTQHEAAAMVRDLPRGAALLHGDLHPANVLMSGSGPIVIDWFDASIGHPVADVVRSSILIRPKDLPGEPAHLPGASPRFLRELHATYVEAMADVLDAPADVLRRWEAVVAASRLAEQAEADDTALVALWEGRNDSSILPLAGVGC